MAGRMARSRVIIRPLPTNRMQLIRDALREPAQFKAEGESIVYLRTVKFQVEQSFMSQFNAWLKAPRRRSSG